MVDELDLTLFTNNEIFYICSDTYDMFEDAIMMWKNNIFFYADDCAIIICRRLIAARSAGEEKRIDGFAARLTRDCPNNISDVIMGEHWQ